MCLPGGFGGLFSRWGSSKKSKSYIVDELNELESETSNGLKQQPGDAVRAEQGRNESTSDKLEKEAEVCANNSYNATEQTGTCFNSYYNLFKCFFPSNYAFTIFFL